MRLVRFNEADVFEAGRQFLHQLFAPAGIHEIAVNDQKPPAGFQDTEPFGKTRLWVHQRPDQMTGDDDVGAFIRLHGVFGIADEKADAASTFFRFFPGKGQHRFRPVHAGNLKTEIVHQV
ncbi:hypothetical protein D3C86_1589540 [compost metagenome]